MATPETEPRRLLGGSAPQSCRKARKIATGRVRQLLESLQPCAAITLHALNNYLL